MIPEMTTCPRCCNRRFAKRMVPAPEHVPWDMECDSCEQARAAARALTINPATGEPWPIGHHQGNPWPKP